jgi:hypothetical protein
MESEQKQDSENIDLVAALGAETSTSTQCFTIYVPNKDRAGQEIGT